ncbi:MULTISPECIES: hypothetical protein [unclassified Crossiella]|uniref:hypothetical protein n=1 Tax=unclassified Crossiella TaxID=2620835 RepID=UPI001FFE6872|nr:MULTISPECIES: hypothetical protein [unclassified Crossiella]MCK2245240.1 hypothetical protein [Crossiella sp. S99.2]MCK2258893.1 hypothetical protein [Crossiella sp. S99.1]
MDLVNPGSGPLPTAHEDTATANIEAFTADVCSQWGYQRVSSIRRPELDYGDGRYAWEVAFLRPCGLYHSCVVQMFGVPRNYSAGQNPLTLPEPRLYVDDSSWVWEFAVSSMAAEDDRETRYRPDGGHTEHGATDPR